MKVVFFFFILLYNDLVLDDFHLKKLQFDQFIQHHLILNYQKFVLTINFYAQAYKLKILLFKLLKVNYFLML